MIVFTLQIYQINYWIKICKLQQSTNQPATAATAIAQTNTETQNLNDFAKTCDELYAYQQYSIKIRNWAYSVRFIKILVLFLVSSQRNTQTCMKFYKIMFMKLYFEILPINLSSPRKRNGSSKKDVGDQMLLANHIYSNCNNHNIKNSSLYN